MGHKVLDMTEGLTLIYLNMYDGLEARNNLGTSLVVQWLGLYASTAGGKDSIPGRETKTLIKRAGNVYSDSLHVFN